MFPLLSSEAFSVPNKTTRCVVMTGGSQQEKESLHNEGTSGVEFTFGALQPRTEAANRSACSSNQSHSAGRGGSLNHRLNGLTMPSKRVCLVDPISYDEYELCLGRFL